MRWLLLPLTVFCLTLALVVGFKLNGESIALLIGLALGLLAGLPSQLILLHIANRPHSHTSIPPAPPNPPQPVQPRLPQPASLPAPRRFVVIGADEPSA